MAEYKIDNVEYQADQAFGPRTICEVVIRLTEDEYRQYSSESELPGVKPRQMTYWIEIDNKHLFLLTQNPLADSDEIPDPLEAFNLLDCNPYYLMDQHPGLDLWDYDDPLAFFDEDNQCLHRLTGLFNVCFMFDQAFRRQVGHC